MHAFLGFCGLREWRRRRGDAAPVKGNDETFSRASSLSTFSELADAGELATKADAEAAAQLADTSELMRKLKLLPAQSTDGDCHEKPAESSKTSSREASPHGRRTN